MSFYRLVFISTALLLTKAAFAHEVLLDPQCKQGTCYHVMIKNIIPVQFLRAGTLLG
jgi:hypothetical protein